MESARAEGDGADAQGGDRSPGKSCVAVDQIRSDFPEQTWEIFWRLAMVGDKPTDVAAELGISVASVYTAKCRVLKYLRLELGDLLE